MDPNDNPHEITNEKGAILRPKKALLALAAVALLVPETALACVLVPPAPNVPSPIKERMKDLGMTRPHGSEPGPQGCEPGDRMHSRGFLPVRQMLRLTTQYCDLDKEVVTVASGLNVHGKRLVGLVCVYRPPNP